MTDEEIAEVVAGRVADVLGFRGDPPARVTDAAAATIASGRRYLFGPEDDPPTAPAPVLPSGPDVLAGLTAQAVRIYHDPASPGGVVGGDAYTGAAIPEDLWAHTHHYLDPYRTAWGLA